MMHTRRLIVVAIWILSLQAFSNLNLSAQTFAGSLTGLVLDEQNSVVVGANVTLTSTVTGESRKLTTNSAGRYTFSQLLPSTYNLRVSVPGFKEFSQTGLLIGTNQSAEIDVHLTLGNLTEVVEVSAQAPLLDTQTANRATSLDAKLSSDLPLFYREPLHLVYATPGVVMTETWGTSDTEDENSSRFAMNGGRENAAIVIIDGIPAKLPDWGGLLISPGVDTVKEMQILATNYEAQYGRTSGGIINITTKGGSDQYHGTAFEYLRASSLDANSFFNNLYGAPTPTSHRNSFGGNFSGPVWKSKRLFGFFGYEGLRETDPSSYLTSVPTDPQRQGNFSQTFNPDGSLQTIYNPFSTRLNASGQGYTRDPFPNNTVPGGMFDPVGANMMKLYPEPNQAGDAVTGLQNWYKAASAPTLSDRWEFRVDWSPTSNYTMFLRGTKANQYEDAPTFLPAAVDPGNNQTMPRYQLAMSNSLILSPTMVVNVMIGAAPTHETAAPHVADFNWAQLGFPTSVTSQLTVKAPPIISVGNYTNLGYQRELSITRNVYNLQVNATKEHLSHSFKFGFSFEDQQTNDRDGWSPNFNFDQTPTLGPDPDSRTGLTGNGLASLLLGAGSGGTWNTAIWPAATEKYWAWYFQDTWKATRRLTLNYGLRYEIQPGRTERYNRGNYFDFNVVNPIGDEVGLPGLKGGLVFLSGQNRQWWDTAHNDFQPRLGIAYKITDHIVLRTGYGIFFSKSAVQPPTVGTQGYSTNTPWITSLDGGRTVANTLSNAFSQLNQPVGSSLGLLTQVGNSVTTYDRNRPDGYTEQYSFQLESQLGKNTKVDLGYAGNQGRKLLYGYTFQMNQLPDSALALGSALLDPVPNPFYGVITSGSLSGPTVQRGQLLRPYPQYTSVGIADMPGASSSFNALTAKLTHQFSNGLTLIASYQFSKAIDNCSEDIAWAYGDWAKDFNNMSLSRSVSGHDMPNDLKVIYIYELPVGRGKLLGRNWNRALDTVLGGWGFSGMYILTSGLPAAFMAPNNTYSFGGSQSPNVSDRADIQIDNPTRERAFNTSVFSQPVAFTFGNMPRWSSEVRSGRNNNMNLALVKEFKVTEKVRGQVRGEAFNAFNYNRFGPPDTYFSSPTFGQYTWSSNQPRWIQFGFRMTF